MTSTQPQPAVTRVDWLAGNIFRSNPDGSVDIAIIPAVSDARSNGEAIVDPEANPTVLRFPSADAAADFARQLTQFANNHAVKYLVTCDRFGYESDPFTTRDAAVELRDLIDAHSAHTDCGWGNHGIQEVQS